MPAGNPLIWAGQLPVLDVFTDAMLALGLYLIWKHRDLDRSKLVFISLIGGIILITLGGPVNLTILVPPIYMVVTGGIGYLSDHWLKVFPSNPLARVTGMTILVLAVLVSMNFQFRRYFVALPHALSSNQTVVKQQSQVSATIKR
jgi:hypothetical protein